MFTKKILQFREQYYYTLRKEGFAMIYGYARCSTNETKQDINRQKRELKECGVEEKNIYFEYQSGTKTDRIQLLRLLDIVQQGDTIISTELSRITRSTKQLIDIIDRAKEKHLKLIIGTFLVDCTQNKLDAMTLGMLQMMGVFAELERNIISERVKSGLENARVKGKKLGRPVIDSTTIPSNFMKYYPKLKKNEINVTEIARLCNMSRTSVYKYIHILGE
ncbi:MAG: recombinase family protein [Sulfurospirillaceae bacterium]|nr:recombinase family protein [Sulfurospirillaceae bacterium]